MSSEVRVLSATALLTAVLMSIAWWLGRHHGEIARRVHRSTVTLGERTEAHLPVLAWGSEPPRALPANHADAGWVLADAPHDAGEAMRGAEADLAAILIPALCGPVYGACQCGAYPSPDAQEEERARATSCEEDALRDYRAWWATYIDGPVTLRDPDDLSHLLRPLAPESCLENVGDVGRFLLSDSVEGEPCVMDLRCRDGSACEDGRCLRYRGAGERCIVLEEMQEAESALYTCGERLDCVAGVCRVEVGARFVLDSMYATDVGECGPRAFYLRDGDGGRCVPIGAACTRDAECGDGTCAGASESRCVPAPDAVAECPSGDCEGPCPPGQFLGGDEDACVRFAQEGERCEETVCEPGTTCARFVTNGRCISVYCQSTALFDDVRSRF